MDLAAIIRDIPDFPVKGILFKDITPLLREPNAYRQAVEQLAERYRGERSIRSWRSISGIHLCAALALELGAGFVPVRKPGKLPSDTIAVSIRSNMAPIASKSIPMPSVPVSVYWW